MTHVKLVPGARTKCVSTCDSPLILGAGGWNIFHHCGVLKALEERGIKAGEVLGVSAGSMAAAFYTNGYTPDEMVQAFLKLADERENFGQIIECFTMADPLAMSVGGPISLKPLFKRLITDYGLEPNKRLKIVACDLFTHEPVVFKGTDYNLVDAMAASGSVPGVYQPVWHFDNGRARLLVDGAIYHYSPTEFSDGPCIVSKFRPATQPPREWKTPVDLYFHFRELVFPLAGNHRYVDEEKHLVIETGLPYVAALNNGLSKETMLLMVENGREIAGQLLDKAREEGRFCNAS